MHLLADECIPQKTVSFLKKNSFIKMGTDLFFSENLTNVFTFDIIKFRMWLTKKQQEAIGKALYNTANLILAIIVLGQFVAKDGIHFSKLLFGFLLWVILFIVATTLINKEE